MSIDVIGIDFDNTIICYDELFFDLACEQNLIDKTVRPIKKDVRDAIRRASNGEMNWQKLQALVYGPMIHRAKLFEGMKNFLVFCREHAVKVVVVSHKNQYAAQDETKCDLRAAALRFLQQQGILDEKAYGLSAKNVFFEPTRKEKIERIIQLECDIFVDDLTETFLEDDFPGNIQKVLFNPYQESCNLDSCLSVSGWDEVTAWLKAKV